VFQSKHRSQAFGNIKNAKNNRWDPCQFTFWTRHWRSSSRLLF
jgi:hypothetical protein